MVLPSIFLLLFLISHLPIHTATYRAESELDPSRCRPFNCGNFSGIGYPFWSDALPNYCGHPAFKLDCANPRSATFNISALPYLVVGINPEDRILTIARTDIVSEQDICSSDQTLVNTTLDDVPPSLYSLTRSDEIATLYCNCNGTKTTKLEVYLDSATTNLTNGQASVCSRSVSIPVLVGAFGDLMRKSEDVGTVLDVLRKGFQVTWEAGMVLCEECKGSRGVCIHNSTDSGWTSTSTSTSTSVDGSFACLCSDSDSDSDSDSHKAYAYPSSCPVLPGTLPSGTGKSSNVRMKAIIGVIVLVGSLVILSITFCLYKIFVQCKFNKENDEDIETFTSNYGALAMKRYRFKEIKKMTDSFKEKLGEGGFGSVYKGKLSDGRVVAVKVLKLSKGNGGEFLNEVASISRTSHVNVVTLLGYCLESNKRVLIFEFMSNGSLDKFIRNRASCSGTGMVLAWQKLYEIAIGVARGLEYLHRGCNTRIVHFDIKPHNILLDDDFRSKISDFGLAKLSNARESIMSSMMEARGTIGYIAPEVFNRNFGNVSSKSDVYSYGMLLLDIIGARQRDHTEVGDADGTGSSPCYFPNGIYKQVELERYDLYGSPTMEEVAIVKRMTLIGLWCIQPIPSSRPAMSKVIEMLEGSMEALETPPKPFLFSPPRLPVASSSTSTTETG